MNDILKHKIEVCTNILKSFGLDLEKAVYVDNAENRRLGRVGLPYSRNKSVKTDRNGNFIGDGSFHATYDVIDFSKEYPQIKSRVSKSNTTESVYVTYSSGLKSITLRFSNHENNAVKFGDQLNGYIASKDEILYHLGLKKRVFIPDTRLSVPYQQIKQKEVKNYEQAPLTIQEIYSLGEGADISKYKGKIAKNSNYLITGDKIEKFEVKRVDSFGQTVRVGTYKYE